MTAELLVRAAVPNLPAQAGIAVIAECTPLHRGKRTMVWLTRITSGQGRLLSVVTQTQMVL